VIKLTCSNLLNSNKTLKVLFSRFRFLIKYFHNLNIIFMFFFSNSKLLIARCKLFLHFLLNTIETSTYTIYNSAEYSSYE